MDNNKLSKSLCVRSWSKDKAIFGPVFSRTERPWIDETIRQWDEWCDTIVNILSKNRFELEGAGKRRTKLVVEQTEAFIEFLSLLHEMALIAKARVQAVDLQQQAPKVRRLPTAAKKRAA